MSSHILMLCRICIITSWYINTAIIVHVHIANRFAETINDAVLYRSYSYCEKNIKLHNTLDTVQFYSVLIKVQHSNTHVQSIPQKKVQHN